MHNFRQFHGENQVDFPTGDKGRNVVVLHGHNGSGKTCLLNAFVWCLYGETTPDLESPERMVNERALAELAAGDQCLASVELRYSDGSGEDFVAKRVATASRAADGSIQERLGDVSLGVHRLSGEFETLQSPQLYLSKMLPKDLYPFFFFNGERVETLAGKDAYERVEGGVKTLLNVEVFERGVKHLEKVVAKELLEKLKAHGGQSLADEVNRRSDLENQRDCLLEKIDEAERNIAALDDEMDQIDQRRSQMAELHELIAKRKAAEGELDAARARLREVEEETRAEISRNGFLAFARGTLDTTQGLVAEAREKGDLPAKLKPQFVDDLLESRICICGRVVSEHSPEEQELLDWKESVGLAALEEAISSTAGAIPNLLQRREHFFQRIDDLRGRQDQELSQIRDRTDAIAELKDRIGDRSASEEQAELDQRWRTLSDRKSDEVVFLKEQGSALADINEGIKASDAQIAKLEAADEQGKRVKRQKESVGRVADALGEISELQKRDVRSSLDAIVSEMWSDAAVKDYRARVSKDFRLELFKTVAGSEQPVHGASTGEKQVLALAFVGALVRKAREISEGNRSADSALSGGGDYPLVMDSPFGSLEEDYQAKVADWIPGLAKQVVMMVSRTQWTKQVSESVADRIGAEYILELHSTKPGSSLDIQIGNETYPYVVEGDQEFEHTAIRKVG